MASYATEDAVLAFEWAGELVGGGVRAANRTLPPYTNMDAASFRVLDLVLLGATAVGGVLAFWGGARLWVFAKARQPSSTTLLVVLYNVHMGLTVAVVVGAGLSRVLGRSTLLAVTAPHLVPIIGYCLLAFCHDRYNTRSLHTYDRVGTNV